jgi:outer membrane protein with beta-barrel domain
MRTISRVLLLFMPVSCLLFAQEWEAGGGGGYGVNRNLDVNAGSVRGTAGLSSGFAFSALVGNQINRWLGGEVRYTYQSDDLRVSSGAAEATAGAESHAIHYDFLIYGTPKEAPVRPFLAAGAGMKLYRGTGSEPAYQPLSNLVVLTHATEAQALISVGGGLKFPVSRRALVRVDFRDYATPVPTKLLATPPGSRLGGWVHDFVFLVGVSAVL